jgi:hypothetical protein
MWEIYSKQSPLVKVLFAFMIGWVFVVLLFIILGPWLSFSEIERQSLPISIIASALTLTSIITTFVMTVSNHKKIITGRLLIYPLMLVSYGVWFLLIGFSYSAVFLWFMFLLIPLFFFGVPLMILIGYLVDRKFKKNIEVNH